MSDISAWSITATFNNAAAPDGAPEGMAPSSVNDVIRENMAATKRLALDMSWFNWGHVPVQISTKAFRVSFTATDIYTTGRALRLYDAGSQLYAMVKASNPSGANTVISITGTSGVSSSLTSVAIAAYNPAQPSVWGVIPAGCVIPYAGSTAPMGWVLCDGTSYTRTAMPALFAAIGTTFGAADGSHFNVPDLRGRAVFGKDDMGGSAASRVTNAISGVDGVTLGASGGSQSLQAHTHTISLGNAATGGGGSPGGAGSQSTASTGAGSSQNMPPALICNYIIKF